MDGRGLLYARGLWSLVAARRAPRLVVLDVTWSADERENARGLALFYGSTPVLDEILAGSDWRARVEFASRTFRFNGAALPMLANYGAPGSPYGFRPLDGTLPQSTAWGHDQADVHPPASFETELRAFVRDVAASGGRIVFVESPSWGHRFPSDIIALYERVATNDGLTFLRYGPGNPAFARVELFHDVGHVNREGARVQSALLAQDLAPALK
jgi:hypothetical protein